MPHVSISENGKFEIYREVLMSFSEKLNNGEFFVLDFHDNIWNFCLIFMKFFLK